MKTMKTAIILVNVILISFMASCKKEKPITAEKKGITMVSTIIGKSKSAWSFGGYVDGRIGEAELGSIGDMVIDAAGNIYFTDMSNNVVRKISMKDGIVSTVAGSLFRERGLVNGIGTAAKFNNPKGLAIDGMNNLYVADVENHCIRKITPAGVVSTIAGNGEAGYADGAASLAQFSNPNGVTIDVNGNLYIADIGNRRIRKITTSGMVSTFAGDGSRGAVDGSGVNARFSSPSCVKTDVHGNIYVSEYGFVGSALIRKITPEGMVSTYAGGGGDNGPATAAGFRNPGGICLDATGNIYVADIGGYSIRKINPDREVSTVAGIRNSTTYNLPGYVDGSDKIALFYEPSSVVVDKEGNIYVGDNGNHALRKISFE